MHVYKVDYVIRIEKDNLNLDGTFGVIATETAMLLAFLREKDKDMIPAILSCVYTEGGDNDLARTIAGYKEDTAKTIKYMEEILKNGRIQ